MRYQGNKIVVRQKTDAVDSAPAEVTSTEQDESSDAEPDAEPQSAPAPASRRKRS